jgi:prevent-host-death family protein
MMTVTVNVSEAKATLSSLIKQSLDGEDVFISSRGTPVVRLTALTQKHHRPLGFIKATLPDTFFDPLPPEELELWGS